MTVVLVLLMAIMLIGLASSFSTNKFSTRTPRTMLSMADMVTHYEELSVKTNTGVSLVDITSGKSSTNDNYSVSRTGNDACFYFHELSHQTLLTLWPK